MAANDLLGTIEAAHALGLGTLDIAAANPKGTLLASAITAVSERLAKAVGTIVYATVTAELHDGGGNIIYLDHQPIQGVTQVVEYDETTASTLTAETNATKTSTNYVVDLDNGRLIRRDSNADARFPRGRSNVLVSYVAGRFAGTSSVGQRYKEAAEIMLKNVWRTYENAATSLGEFEVPQGSFPRFGIPNAVKHLLADQWREGSGVGD